MRVEPLLIALLLSGCAHHEKTASSTATAPPPQHAEAAPAPKKSLYERLGGRPAITAVVDEFVGRVAADKRINGRFFNTDIARLKGLLVEFVCSATGGPEKYEGRDMHTTHAGLELVDEEFDALVGDLKGALDKLNVPAPEQNELLGALGPLKPQIVNPPPEAAKKHCSSRLVTSIPASMKKRPRSAGGTARRIAKPRAGPRATRPRSGRSRRGTSRRSIASWRRSWRRARRRRMRRCWSWPSGTGSISSVGSTRARRSCIAASASST